MKALLKVQALALVLLAVAAPGAKAQGGAPIEVGVYLPTSVADGNQRLKIAEALAAKLQEALGMPVTGKSFGRFEDFSQALSSGAITLGLIDGWAAGQLPAAVTPVAVGHGAGDKARLQLVAKTQSTVPSLKGSRLAVVRGASGQEAKFLTNVVFEGDLQAQKHFKLVPVPNAESALQAIDAGAADAALVPAAFAKGLPVAYQAPAFPVAFLVKGKKGLPTGLTQVIAKIPAGPVERFAAARGDELTALRADLNRGARRSPVMADSPIERFDAALVDSESLGLTLPSFGTTVTLPEETPDD